MNHNLTKQKFDALEHEVNICWPCSKYMPQDKKTVTVFDYAKRYVRKNSTAETEYRRDEFRKTFSDEVEKLLGYDVAQSVYNQLTLNHSISTAQHYTPFSHPNTVNPTIQTAIDYVGKEGVERRNVIVLACSGISFVNPWFPRGHYFNTLVNDNFVKLRLPFFGRAVDSKPVIFSESYNRSAFKQIEKRLRHYQSERLLKKREFKIVHQLLTEVLFDPKILEQQLYIDQLSIQNFYLWKKIFTHVKKPIPNLIFFSQEKIAIELIAQHHLLNSSTLIHKILFDPKFHERILKNFNNILCAFSVERDYGTFLFWGQPKGSTTRIRLMPKNGKLISSDQSFSVKMTPENLSQAIKNREIIPSVLLTFIVIAFYYGFFLSGGLDQPWYLSEAKEAYEKMLLEIGGGDEVKYLSKIVTNDSVITRPSLLFLESLNNIRVPASGLDLILYGRDESWPTVINSSKNVTYQEILYRLYPELYRDYCENKRQELSDITEKDMDGFTKIDQKIPVWATLKSRHTNP